MLKNLATGFVVATLFTACSEDHHIRSPSCEYTYSDWSACQADGTQTRTVVSSTPADCAGTPVFSQSCAYTPSCEYTYSDWSACQADDTQSRTVASSTPTDCVGTPDLSQACTYVPPSCEYTYSDWSACQADDTQSRTVASSTPTDCVGAPDLSRSCDYVADYGIVINPIPGLASDFIKGADVSMLAQIEAVGGKFYDESGVEKDCLQILREHGVNWVRLRLWNNPVLAHDLNTDGRTVLAGQSAGGINDAARDTELALRAKALGMKVLLDFHYSDWWADPGKQIIPAAWEAHTTVNQMASAVYAFTHQVIDDMQTAGATPDMVQIGNELNDGMLWPVGKISGVNGFDGFAALLAQGVQAVRDVDPSIQVMIQLANGGDNDMYRWVFSNLIERDVDFDIIGLSYYPYWHGPMSDLQFNMADISSYFNKPVLVVETAYAYTLADADTEANNFAAMQERLGGYRATVQGQATFVRDLMAAVAGVPDRRGLGIFYWEPDWIAVAGAGWYTAGGDGWDNQAMFDTTGKALASLNVFKAVSDDRPFVEATMVSIIDQDLQVAKSTTAPTLPTNVGVIYSDSSMQSMYVVWDEVNASMWDTVGTFDITGAVVDSVLVATLHVEVRPNLVQDPGFESGAAASWTVTDPVGVTSVDNDSSAAHTGIWAFHYWDAAALNFTVQQTISGLEAATSYSFSVWAMGNAGGALEAFATCGTVTQTAAISNTGWQNWGSYTISNLDGTSGSCTVGVRAINANANDWGNIDDFLFTY